MTPQEYIDRERRRALMNLERADERRDKKAAERLVEKLEVLKEIERGLKLTVTREQVEKMRGEWIVGEQNVFGALIHCSRCGWGTDHGDDKAWMEYGGHIFCGHCGTPMTDEAMEIAMDRLNEIAGEEEEHG